MTPIALDLPDLDAAIDAEIWDWLLEAHEPYARAVEREVQRGNLPEAIRARYANRGLNPTPDFAERLEQAACHLIREATR